MKIAVYSNYCGSESNAIRNVNYNQTGGMYPHYFYTNNSVVGAKMQGAGWIYRNLDTPLSDNADISCMQAKEQKIRPHLLDDLKDYDFVVFRDAKMTGLDFKQLPRIIQLMRDRCLHSAFPVHARSAVAEACESMFQPRYAAQRGQICAYICEELARGRLARMPIHFGCNMFVRDMRHAESPYLEDNWAEHTLRVGLQDQISFHFVAQQFPDILAIPQEFGFRTSEVAVPDWV